MKSRKLCLSAFVFLWFLGETVEADLTKEKADSLFQAAMGQVGRAPVKESLKAFEHVLKADWNYAPAHYEMAKLYTSLNTVVDRQRARDALDKALKLDPENVTYQLTMGDLLWVQGLWLEAREQYEKVLKAHPDNAMAAYGIGYYFLKDFLKYQEITHYDPDVEGIFEWKWFAEEDRKKAVFYLERCMEMNPSFRDAYYQLGVLYLESKQPATLVRIAEQLLKQYPGDKDALLFCALGYQTTGNPEKVYALYAEAIKQMDSEERAMMESVDLIATKEEQKQIGRAGVPRQEEDAPKSWLDSPERDGFWRRQDPLFLTEFNERRMEHYSRVAYANLCFSQPSRGVPGWRTDMGKAYIKFGRAIHKNAQWPNADAMRSPMRVYPHLETWSYEGFQVTFLNWDGLDGWRFASARVFGLGSLSTDPSLSVFQSKPPRYVDPYRNKKYSLPHQIAAFQEGDSVRVELSYAIPKDRLKMSESKGVVELKDGFFLFDEDWKEVYQKTIAAILKEPESAREDSLRKDYLLAQREVYVRPGPYHVVVEAMDKGTGSIGTFREARTFSFSDSILSISDLLLASRIETQKPSPEDRKDLKVVPNPLRTFLRSEAVSVYFEVYNLTQDASGRMEYDVSYRIGRPEKKEVDPALFAALDLPEAHGRVEIERVVQEEQDKPERVWERSGGPVEYRVRYVLPDRNRISDQVERIERGAKGTEIAVTARYAGERKDDLAYLQIDMTWMPKGVYKLTVRIKDMQTGQVAERNELFRVIE